MGASRGTGQKEEKVARSTFSSPSPSPPPPPPPHPELPPFLLLVGARRRPSRRRRRWHLLSVSSSSTLSSPLSKEIKINPKKKGSGREQNTRVFSFNISKKKKLKEGPPRSTAAPRSACCRTSGRPAGGARRPVE